MNEYKLSKSLKSTNYKFISQNLYKGACVKIKDSQKTYQVIGINSENKICWVREWPFYPEVKKTFALKINDITLQIFCSKQLT